jgi:hypothetical protein
MADDSGTHTFNLKDNLPGFRESDNDAFVNGKYLGVGTATASPTVNTATVGAGALIFDSTNNKLYINNGSKWVAVTLS